MTKVVIVALVLGVVLAAAVLILGVRALWVHIRRPRAPAPVYRP
jgi:hypothetical protein